MIRLLDPVWRPTLLRRVLGALLVAFAMAAAALLAVDFATFKQDMAKRPGVQLLAEGIAASLTDVADARDARLIVQSRARELDRLRSDTGLVLGSVEFSLSDEAGRLVFATQGAETASAESHWVAESRSGRWRLMIAEPRLEDTTVLAWIGRDLATSMALAFPLVLAPLWVAVRTGMRPLNRLAAIVARRDAHDLSPLGFVPQHEELKPLTAAFDGLLARLRRQVQRERAFVQDAAHELRTPMAVLATQAHLLVHAKDDDERRQAGAALNSTLQRTSHLSGQLLTLAALDDGAVGEGEELDLSAVAEQTLAGMASRALEAGLELSLEAPAAIRIRLDRHAFESVLINLVDNALRYVPGKGCRVEVTLQSGEGEVTLRVADDGEGIPVNQREACFERFWRGAGSADVQGTGLGLAIVKQAAAQLRGGIEISGGLDGRGVSFLLKIPR